ncbi:transposase (plasmid) [Mesorhizobium sp. AR07]|nr:transposase [Mesorhizobium sp. AR07]
MRRQRVLKGRLTQAGRATSPSRGAEAREPALQAARLRRLAASSPGRRCRQGGLASRHYDGGKRISGRRCHMVVDTQGLILHVLVHLADVHDRRAAEAVLAGTVHPLLM